MIKQNNSPVGHSKFVEFLFYFADSYIGASNEVAMIPYVNFSIKKNKSISRKQNMVVVICSGNCAYVSHPWGGLRGIGY